MINPSTSLRINLDAASTYREIDAGGMLNHLHAFPEQCCLAWEKVAAFDLPKAYRQIDKVVVLGLGGSAIGGDMVASLAWSESKAPILVHRDYDLPPFVDKNTLVIASSYSGNTEETLSAFGKALKTPAKKLAITTGGKLAEVARKEVLPVYTIDYKAAPRAAFPHSFVPLFGIIQKTGLIADKSTDFKKMLQALARVAQDCAKTVPTASNPAKRLATDLVGRVTVVYGAETLSPVARRWKTQLNENSKAWAFYEVLPELNHNAVVGYPYPQEAKKVLTVLLLHSALLHPRTHLRYQATAKLLADAGITHQTIEANGEGPLAQAISLLLFGDYVSFYLALLTKVDPTPVKVIDYLKSFLAQSPFPPQA